MQIPNAGDWYHHYNQIEEKTKYLEYEIGNYLIAACTVNMCSFEPEQTDIPALPMPILSWKFRVHDHPDLHLR